MLFNLYLHSAPGGPPTSVTATSINSTAILLTWLSPDRPNGIVTSYTIVYNITHQENTTVAVGGNVYSYLAADLNEYTVYTFSISASTRVGSGPSAHVTTRTDESCKSFHVYCITSYPFYSSLQPGQLESFMKSSFHSTFYSRKYPSALCIVENWPLMHSNVSVIASIVYIPMHSLYWLSALLCIFSSIPCSREAVCCGTRLYHPLPFLVCSTVWPPQWSHQEIPHHRHWSGNRESVPSELHSHVCNTAIPPSILSVHMCSSSFHYCRGPIQYESFNPTTRRQ